MALTQFPRCVYGIQYGPRNTSLPLWALNDCDDVARADFTHMGLSLRTPDYRFTRWFPWDGKTLQPVWTAAADAVAVELYDHRGDTGMSFEGEAGGAAVPSLLPLR